MAGLPLVPQSAQGPPQAHTKLPSSFIAVPAGLPGRWAEPGLAKTTIDRSRQAKMARPGAKLAVRLGPRNLRRVKSSAYMAAAAWIDGNEVWAAGAQYAVRRLLDARHNVATGVREFRVRWEDEIKVDPQTGVAHQLNWSDPQYDSWEPAANVPQGMCAAWIAAQPQGWVIPQFVQP